MEHAERNSTTGLSAPTMHVSCGTFPRQDKKAQICTHRPSLCCGDPQGAPEPHGVAVAWVWAVLALIWKHTRQCYLRQPWDRASERNCNDISAAFPPVSQGDLAGALQGVFPSGHLCCVWLGFVLSPSPWERLCGAVASCEVVQRCTAAMQVLLLVPSCSARTKGSMLPSHCLSQVCPCPYPTRISFKACF